MSDDSLGLKAVSRVAETDRFPFLKALAHIAVADDSVTIDEEEMILQYTDAWNLGADEQTRVQDILDARSSLSLDALVSEFSESGTRFLLMQEVLRLSHADGTYGSAERKQVGEIAARMGMSKKQLREVEEWVERGQAWGAASDDGPGKEELDEVVNRSEETEYDLSDIETSDADLSDIEPEEDN